MTWMRTRLLTTTMFCCPIVIGSILLRSNGVLFEPGSTTNISAQGTEIVLPAAADTWVHQSILPPERRPPPEVHGDDPALRSGVHDAQGSWHALVRFDLSSIPTETTIDSAVLELYASVVSGTDRTRSGVRALEGLWDEASLEDGSLPETGPELDQTTPSGLAWTEWDITAAVGAWQAGAANHGVVVSTYGDFEVSAAFGSRESEHPPRLVINGTPLATETATPTESPAPTPAPELPDLSGYAAESCDGPLSIVVENRSLVGVGHFVVRSATDVLVVVIDSLDGEAKATHVPSEVLDWPLTVDADDEVEEANEGNNQVYLAVPACPGETILLPLAIRNW